MINKYNIVLILLLLPIFIVKPQNEIEDQFNRAEKLFSESKYFEAITEYKRYLFFDAAKTRNYEIFERIAECYKAGAHFEEAIKYYRLAEKETVDDEKLFLTKINLVRVNILRKTASQAFAILSEIESNEKYRFRKNEINYWRGWVYIFEDDWKNAALNFDKINPYHELKLISERTNRSKVSVTFAKVISYILPGLGLIYTGNFLQGLLSLSWNAASGYLTINSFAEKRVFDGIVTGELLFLRFYRGSVQAAEEEAVQKNINISNKTLTYLQKEYKGLKP
jgi:tetratricopeptide (TPR) repeat protein